MHVDRLASGHPDQMLTSCGPVPGSVGTAQRIKLTSKTATGGEELASRVSHCRDW